MKLKIFRSIPTTQTEAQQKRHAWRCLTVHVITHPADTAFSLSLSKQSLNCPFCQREETLLRNLNSVPSWQSKTKKINVEMLLREMGNRWWRGPAQRPAVRNDRMNWSKINETHLISLTRREQFGIIKYKIKIRLRFHSWLVLGANLIIFPPIIDHHK